ncbi:MAG: acyl-CoA dehydrogenase family protein [Proteobacteria bacterium]|nr:acyl-CoA dehydrogenase family protein [Pseudomonadota bacterium]
MFSLQLSDDQQAVLDLAKTFSRKEMMPLAAKYDESMEYPWEVIKKAHEAGLLNLSLKEEHGGLGLGALLQAMVVEELGYGCSAMATAITANDLALGPVLPVATPEQLEEFIKPMVDKPIMAAYCVTEPGAGSDVAGIKTSCKRDGDNYILNGEKMWITNGSVASWYFVLATLDASQGHKAMCGFIVPSNLPGIAVGKKEVNMGQRCSDTRGIVFKDVKIPKKYLLGKEGEGFKYAMKAFDHSRPFVAAVGVGIAQCAMDHSVKYALERKAFGKPIAEHQAVAFMIADMAKDVEAARLLYQKAGWMADQGMRNTKWCSFAKCFGGDIAVRVSQDAVQIFGGFGYSTEYPVEKLYRDSKICQIYEGTQQIQRLIISRAVFGEAQG